jgi:transcriptional regulator with XRE-family HTH domain
METFGSWVQSLRKNAQLDLRSLSLMSDMHFTTINRIEKSQNEPTLLTAIKIASALNGRPTDLYRKITGMKPLSPWAAGDYHPFFPNENDLMMFERLIVEKPKTVAEFIATLLNKIYSDFSVTGAAASPEKQQPGGENKEQQWLHESFRQPFFKPLDIFKLLLNYPSHLFGMTLFSPCLNYPNDMEVEMIRQAYTQTGVLLIQDLKTYVSSMRDEFVPEKTSADYETARKFAEVITVKERFCALSQISGVKIGDILVLDQAISDQHDFFMMAWNAAQEEIRQKTEYDGFGASKLLITISRFLSVHPGLEPNWLMDLRAMA